MTLSRIILALIMATLIGVPIALAPSDGAGATARNGKTLVIFTPHHETIREEFKRGFEAWHQRTYGESVEVVWSAPGGTSDIRKMLEAACVSALRRGLEPGGQGDLLFGGGSYEFRQLSKELSSGPAGPGETPRKASVLAPVDLGDEVIAATYGGRKQIGDNPLYDQKGMWFGAALSGFGIVFNRDLLKDIGMTNIHGGLIEPARWSDLCDPRFEGWIALVNPAQSGSVTTAYEAILQRRGWHGGWQILHRLAGNARTFSASSPRAPTDVSLGDAAAGICIDFYGRYQSQAIEDAGDDDQPIELHRTTRLPRVGYIDPAGETVIDPDPVAMLRGAPNPELAKRFILFTLSPEGQALWNFRAKTHRTGTTDGLGPERHELRRMPIRPSMYDDHLDRLVDRVNPYDLATTVKNANPDYRAFLPAMFVAMAIENRSRMHAAWHAILHHPAYPKPAVRDREPSPIVTADDVQDPALKEMIARFDSFPQVPGPNGTLISLGEVARLKELKDGWIGGGWREHGLWPADAAPAEVLRGIMTNHYREQYDAILDLADRVSGGAG